METDGTFNVTGWLLVLFALIQVQEEVRTTHEDVVPSVITACFLVQEGADVYIQNLKGHTPLQLSPPNVIIIVMKYVGRYIRYNTIWNTNESK